ncbi:MAG: hypothetical protein JSV52_04915 [Candidatus Zixiibacteriota bacterium]|nr:MAG: hypothetical protein JSV52_04915 [candidate division Zixibacteria bacterium]
MKSARMICLGLAAAFALGFVSTVMTPTETCAYGGCPAKQCMYASWAERRPDMDYTCATGLEAWYVEWYTYRVKYDDCAICIQDIRCFSEDPPGAPNEPIP